MEKHNLLFYAISSKNFYANIYRLFAVLSICCQVQPREYETEDTIVVELDPFGLKFKRGPPNRNLGGFPEGHPRLGGHSFDSAVAESQIPEEADADECYTSREKEGRCMTFAQCFPVLFIDGELKNEGLAEVLFQSAGPCNSSFVQDIPPLNGDTKRYFNKAEPHKQMVCCAGYKQVADSPPVVQIVQKDIERKGLISEKLPNIDPVESSLESEYDEEKHNNNKTNLHYKSDYDSKSASVSNIELILAEPPKLHADGDEYDNHYIKVPVIPGPPHDLTPWHCPGRQMHLFNTRGQWPWLVALLNDGRHFCSGTLIDTIHILTSASCIYQLTAKDITKVRVIIGDRVMYTTTDGPHHWRKVVRITRHLQYNHQTLENNIAIIAIDSPLPFSANVQAINLPLTDNRSHLKKGIVTGWSGADIGKPFYDQRQAKDAVVELMNWNECHKVYDGFATGGLSRDMLCTKTSNLSCIADAGSPLIAKTESCFHVIGIVSFGLGCGNFPDVYTDVARYLPWIQKNIKHYQHKSVHEILPP